MSGFFIRRPILAIVVSLLTVIVGIISIRFLPVSLFPNITPPEIVVSATDPATDAITVEQSVATPIEEQISGVDKMNYMYSLNANSGQMKLRVNFDETSNPKTDQILTQMRQAEAAARLPPEVTEQGVSVQKSFAAPLMLIALRSTDGGYDSEFLTNYAYINLNDALTRVPGISNVQVFGSGQYAIRIWAKPDQLARFNLTVPDIVNAVQQQNAVHPVGAAGGEPVPIGQEYTYMAKAKGLLVTPEEFGQIVIRQDSDGGTVRIKDVARVELGSQVYSTRARLNGQPSAIIALYQLPGTNALAAADGVKKLMETLKQRFPRGLDYVISLDTTQPVTAGIREMVKTLLEALGLVILVVYLFLQSWRATLIPLLAVPVSLIGTFVLFPPAGFLDQHAFAFRIGAGDWIGGRRCDRGCGSGGTPHSERNGAKGSNPQGDARNYRSCDRGSLGPGGCLCADCLYPGNHRTTLPTVCGHDCRVGHDLGVQRADLKSRSVRAFAASPDGEQGVAGKILRLVQSSFCPSHRKLCPHFWNLYSEKRDHSISAACLRLGRAPFREQNSDQFSTRRRSGFLLCQPAVAQCSLSPAYRRDVPEN